MYLYLYLYFYFVLAIGLTRRVLFITGDEKIKTRGKRRQFDSVTDTGTEREKAQGYIDRLVRREADFTVDVNMAARKIQRAKEAENRSAKKQKLAVRLF